MARPTNRLTARSVATLKVPGRHADGGGLYLVIDPGGSKRWVYIYHRRGKRKEMGLGPVSVVGLGEAREAASAARRIVFDGGDPIEERQKTRAAGRTFGEVADDLLVSKEREWRSAKHKYQWKLSLETYAAPLRPRLAHEITTDDILDVLRPLWDRIPETASRTRGRIEVVLDAAKAKGLRSGENPARWRGHLALLLPKRRRLTRGHHPAMPYSEIASFVSQLRTRKGVAHRALEVTILTVARTSETILALGREFDLDAAVWTVPATRMKMGREHRVPLPPRVVELLRELWPEGLPADGYVFPGLKRGKPLSDMAMTTALRKMGHGAYSVHGFRSTFKDWAEDTTNFPNGVIEAALAHLVGDDTERAYRRGDALMKRRKLMGAWAGFVARPMGGSVTPMARSGDAKVG